MRDWLIVNPTDTTMDGDFSSKERVLELARTVPRREW